MLFARNILFIVPFGGLKRTCKAHGILEGRCGTIAKTNFAQVWPCGMCQRIRAGIKSLINHRRRQYYVPGPDACYPIDCVPLGRRGRGRPRKNPEGIASKEGVIYDCPASMRRLHERHPAHIRNGELLLLCKCLAT